MNNKYILFGGMIILSLSSCARLGEATMSMINAANPFYGLSQSQEVGDFFNDVGDTFSSDLAPRRLEGKQLTLTGTMDERKGGTTVSWTSTNGKYLMPHSVKIDGLNAKNKVTYQVVDIFTFKGVQSFRRGGEINRLNKPQTKITGNGRYSRELAERQAISNALGPNYSAYDCGHGYKKTSPNTARLANSGEVYELTFTEKDKGTYTYIHTCDGALIGKGSGTFVIGKEELPFTVR